MFYAVQSRVKQRCPTTSGPITLLGDTAHSLASRFHLIPSSGDIEAAYAPLPGGARAEAERRRWGSCNRIHCFWSDTMHCRAMALKALDQRLAGGVASPSQPQRSASSSSGASRPAATSVSNGEANTSKNASEVEVAEPEEVAAVEKSDGGKP